MCWILTLPCWIPWFLLVIFLDPSKKHPPARGVAITFDGSGASIKPEKNNGFENRGVLVLETFFLTKKTDNSLWCVPIGWI